MENVQSADKRPNQVPNNTILYELDWPPPTDNIVLHFLQDLTDRLGEMTELVNTHVFGRPIEIVKDGKETMSKEDVLSAAQVQKRVDTNAQYLLESELRGALKVCIQFKYDVDDEVTATIAKKASAEAVQQYGV